MTPRELAGSAGGAARSEQRFRHDLNNLFTAILSSSDLLLEELPADHPARVEAEAIREAALHAVTLTRRWFAHGP
jgi:signal transduction histidine kinase